MSPNNVIVQIVLSDIAAIANREALQSQTIGQQARAFGGATAQNELSQSQSIGQAAAASNIKDIQIAVPLTGGKPLEQFKIVLDVSNLFAGAGGVIRQDQGGLAGAGTGQTSANGDSVEISAAGVQAGADEPQSNGSDPSSEGDIRGTVAETRPQPETDTQTAENGTAGETPESSQPEATPPGTQESGIGAAEGAVTIVVENSPVPDGAASEPTEADPPAAEGPQGTAETAEGQPEDVPGTAGQEPAAQTAPGGAPVPGKGTQAGETGQPESESGSPLASETQAQQGGSEGESAPDAGVEGTADSPSETQPREGSATETETPSEASGAQTEAIATRRTGYGFISAGQFNPALFVSLDDTFKLTFASHFKALYLVGLNSGPVLPRSKFLSELPRISEMDVVT
jgi:hypothetical protein